MQANKYKHKKDHNIDIVQIERKKLIDKSIKQIELFIL